MFNREVSCKKFHLNSRSVSCLRFKGNKLPSKSEPLVNKKLSQPSLNPSNCHQYNDKSTSTCRIPVEGSTQCTSSLIVMTQKTLSCPLTRIKALGSLVSRPNHKSSIWFSKCLCWVNVSVGTLVNCKIWGVGHRSSRIPCLEKENHSS